MFDQRDKLLLQQAVDRLIRVETRITNNMRAQGLLPTVESQPNHEGSAIYKDGTVFVTSPLVSIGEVSYAAVQGIGVEGGTVQIVLNNRLWGQITIEGKGDKHG